MKPPNDGDKGAPHRLFLAVPMSAAARGALRAAIRELPGGGPPGRLVSPDNWHWTLRFIGDCSERRAVALTEAIENAELGPAFSLGIGRLGAFPNPRRARVLWAAPATNAQAASLSALAERVDRAVADHVPSDAKRSSAFQAHLTIARLRPTADVSPSMAAWRAPRTATYEARDIHLYRSWLGHGPPRYEVVASGALDVPAEV